MVKNQKKWIACLVALTFIWLLQVSAMPVSAAGTTEQVSSASDEQGPDFYESVAYKPAPAKKSILPYVLIGVGVLAVAAVLVLVVFKTKYDIVGTWTFVFTGPYNATVHYTFTGDKKSGTWASSDSGDHGTYTVDGKKTTFVVTGRPDVVWTGQFTAKDTMTGTWVEEGDTWIFTATRVATTTGVKTPSSVSSRATGPLASK